MTRVITLWKNPKIYSHSKKKKNFVKSIIACKSLKVQSVEKYRKTRSQFLRKNQHFFRQINVSTKEVHSVEKSSKNYRPFPHCVSKTVDFSVKIVIAFHSTFPRITMLQKLQQQNLILF